MDKFKIIKTLACASFVLTIAGCQTPPVVQSRSVQWTYDFNFMIEGDAMAKPTQAFTDGKNTYLSFRVTQPIGVFTDDDGNVLPSKSQGSYVTVEAVEPVININLGGQYYSKVSYFDQKKETKINLPEAASLTTQ